MPEFLLKICSEKKKEDEFSFDIKIAINTGEKILDFQHGITPLA